MKEFTRSQISKEKRAGIALFIASLIISVIAIFLEFIKISIFYDFFILIFSSILITIVIRRRIKHRVRIIEGMKTILYIGIAMFTSLSLLVNFHNWTEDTLLINLFIIIVSVLESISNYKNTLILDDLKEKIE